MLKTFWDKFDVHTAEMGPEQLKDLHCIMQFFIGLNDHDDGTFAFSQQGALSDDECWD